MTRVLALRIDVVELACMRHLAEDGFEKRALASAVRPDERRELAAMDVDVDVVEDGQPADLDREVLDLRAAELLAVGAR